MAKAQSQAQLDCYVGKYLSFRVIHSLRCGRPTKARASGMDLLMTIVPVIAQAPWQHDHFTPIKQQMSYLTVPILRSTLEYSTNSAFSQPPVQTLPSSTQSAVCSSSCNVLQSPMDPTLSGLDCVKDSIVLLGHSSSDKRGFGTVLFPSLPSPVSTTITNSHRDGWVKETPRTCKDTPRYLQAPSLQPLSWQVSNRSCLPTNPEL